MSRKFKLIRQIDKTGVSGIGHVLDGVEFDNGKVAVTWYTKMVKATSVGVYDSFQDFYDLHIGKHPNAGTRLIWEDEEDFEHPHDLSEDKLI